MTPKFRKVHKA